MNRLGLWLRSRRAPLFFALFAFLLSLPALWGGFFLDDYPQKLSFSPEFRLPGGPQGDWDIFRFQGPDRGFFAAYQERGLWPWWTEPTMRLSFFRPLSSLHHALDYRLWPDAAWLMHLESLLLLSLLVYVVARLHRRFLGETVAAGLAGLFFAVDDAHSMIAFWIANRNALWAVLFGALSLWAHDRWRRDGWRKGAFYGPLLFSLGMLSGEAALGAAAYLFAYTLWLDTGSFTARVKLLLPYVLVGVAWMALYWSMGYGTEGGGFYIDPGREPLEYLKALVIRLPLLLLAQLGLPPSDIWAQVPPEALPMISLVSWGVLLFFGWLFFRALRGDKVSAFFAMGMVLSLFPVCATWPSDRLLLFSGLGAFGLLARVCVVWWESPRGGFFFLRRLMVVGFLLIHVLVAAVLFPLRVLMLPATLGRLHAKAEESLPPSQEFVGRSIVMVNSPDPLVATYGFSIRFLQDGLLPGSVRLLGVTVQGSQTLSRPDERTLTMTLSEGFIHDPFSRIFRGASYPMKPGDEVRLSNMTAHVDTVTEDGRPQTMSFRFSTPLEDPSLIWLRWEEEGFRSFTPPKVGQSITLPAIDYAQAMGMK